MKKYMTQKLARRICREEQKEQLNEQFNYGKSRNEIVLECDLAHSVFDKWGKRIKAIGSRYEKENRIPEEMKLLELRKENQRIFKYD